MTTYQLPRLRPDRLSDEMVGGHALARIFWGYSDVDSAANQSGFNNA